VQFSKLQACSEKKGIAQMLTNKQVKNKAINHPNLIRESMPTEEKKITRFNCWVYSGGGTPK
jgi:hypothetical protein